MNPAPELLTWEIDTLEFPALVIVIPKTLLLPRGTFPNVKLDELAFNREVVEMPIPLTVTVAGEFAALLMTETTPEAIPVAVGENNKLIVDCLPAPMVIGSDTFVIVNP